jgi:hypothetical protein
MRENALTDDVDPAPRILRLLASRLRLSGGPDATELFRGLLDDAIVLEGGRAMSGDECNSAHGRLLARERRVGLRRGSAKPEPKPGASALESLSQQELDMILREVELGGYPLEDDGDERLVRHLIDQLAHQVRSGSRQLDSIPEDWTRERVRAAVADDAAPRTR